MVMLKRRYSVWRRSFIRCFRNKILGTVLITLCGLVVLKLILGKPWEEKDFVQFRKNRNLHYYLNVTKALIEPIGCPCPKRSEITFIVGVLSAPTRELRRNAIRETWGSYFKTIYFLGATQHALLVTLSAEAEKYNDLVVFNFQDHYQNLTIKTGLMFNWILSKCPETYYFIHKADDDHIVNPWHLRDILRNQTSAKMIGNLHPKLPVYRSIYHQWYLPRWLMKEDWISEFYTSSYMINGKYVREILEAAESVPMHNLEDVYFTYNIANKKLHYKLNHASDFKNYLYYIYWAKFPKCFFFCKNAVFGDLSIFEMRAAWKVIAKIGKRYEAGEKVCENCYRKESEPLLPGILEPWW